MQAGPTVKSRKRRRRENAQALQGHETENRPSAFGRLGGGAGILEGRSISAPWPGQDVEVIVVIDDEADDVVVGNGSGVSLVGHNGTALRPDRTSSFQVHLC